MNTRLAKVIAELDELTITMQIVKKHDKPIDMLTFTENEMLFTKAHGKIEDCGTPCCVAGYHALRKNMEEANRGDIPLTGAVHVWVTFSKPGVPRTLLRLPYIIFGGDTTARKSAAQDIQFPNWEDYPHITNKSPDPDDVLSLIRDIKSWLLEKYND
jgi:hypothetical protein